MRADADQLPQPSGAGTPFSRSSIQVVADSAMGRRVRACPER